MAATPDAMPSTGVCVLARATSLVVTRPPSNNSFPDILLAVNHEETEAAFVVEDNGNDGKNFSSRTVHVVQCNLETGAVRDHFLPPVVESIGRKNLPRGAELPRCALTAVGFVPGERELRAVYLCSTDNEGRQLMGGGLVIPGVPREQTQCMPWISAGVQAAAEARQRLDPDRPLEAPNPMRASLRVMAGLEGNWLLFILTPDGPRGRKSTAVVSLDMVSGAVRGCYYTLGVTILSALSATPGGFRCVADGNISVYALPPRVAGEENAFIEAPVVTESRVEGAAGIIAFLPTSTGTYIKRLDDTQRPHGSDLYLRRDGQATYIGSVAHNVRPINLNIGKLVQPIVALLGSGAVLSVQCVHEEMRVNEAADEEDELGIPAPPFPNTPFSKPQSRLRTLELSLLRSPFVWTTGRHARWFPADFRARVRALLGLALPGVSAGQQEVANKSDRRHATWWNLNWDVLELVIAALWRAEDQ